MAEEITHQHLLNLATSIGQSIRDEGRRLETHLGARVDDVRSEVRTHIARVEKLEETVGSIRQAVGGLEAHRDNHQRAIDGALKSRPWFRVRFTDAQWKKAKIAAGLVVGGMVAQSQRTGFLATVLQALAEVLKP